MENLFKVVWVSVVDVMYMSIHINNGVATLLLKFLKYFIHPHKQTSKASTRLTPSDGYESNHDTGDKAKSCSPDR